MLFYRFDADTKIYKDTVRANKQPENSASGELPDITDQYTVAFIDGKWVSVLKPELEIIDNKIQLKQQEE